MNELSLSFKEKVLQKTANQGKDDNAGLRKVSKVQKLYENRIDRNSLEELLTPEEVASLLKIKIKTLYDWTYKGKIKHLKIGKLLRFKITDIKILIDQKSSGL